MSLRVVPLLFAAAALLAAARGAPEVQPFAPGAVLDVTLDSFDAEVAKGPVLLYVGADWCPHCERLKPVWAELAESLRDVVSVARVDGPAQRALSARLSVRGYPTILLLREGTMREYDGATRSASALRSWAVSGYAKSPKAPLLRTPNNALGRVLGAVFRVPSATARARDAAKAALNVGDAALAALAVVAALVATVLGIVALDCALALSARPRPHQA